MSDEETQEVDPSDSREDKQLARARRAATKLGLDRVERHILLCYDKKRAKCAGRKQMAAAYKYLKKRLKELDLRGGVLLTKTHCFDICHGGPIAVVYPDAIWYGRCDAEVLERILQEHILGGQVVRAYVIASREEPST